MGRQEVKKFVPLDFPFSGVEFLLLHELDTKTYCDFLRGGFISASVPLEGRQDQFSSSHLSLDSARYCALRAIDVNVEFEVFDDFIDFLFPIFETHEPDFWASMYIVQEGPFGREDENKLYVFAREFQLSLDSFWERWGRSGLRLPSRFNVD